jgi:tRNA modification GTPase
MIQDTTICAIATPPGYGAISVIRLSGSDTFSICDKICNKQISNKQTHTVHFCKIIDNKEVIDEVLITVFKNPHSYTGEDTAEIGCHGSSYIQQRIMELLLKNGAVLAQPGEFTLRAFLNGKLDLSQAEAVADLIHSSSKAGHDAAINQMRGGFSGELATLRHQLLQFASMIELELDFSEEDVEFANRKELKNNVIKIQEIISKLISSFQYGNVIKNGVPVAIAGKPNVGKSTLLNALLKEEKAIVSEIPGTTRDVIEDTINIEGIPFRFIDTAGIRHTTDTIENLGIERTFENVRKASVVLLLIEVTDSINNIIEQINHLQLNNEQQLAVIFNKIDKTDSETLKNLEIELRKKRQIKSISISAKKRENIHHIHQFLLENIRHKPQSDNDIIITNLRHLEALKNTFTSGERLLLGMEIGNPGDLLAQDIREMLYHLGTITGEITTDEILGNIFSQFCIGK